MNKTIRSNKQSGFLGLVSLIVVVLIIGALFVLLSNYYQKPGGEKTVNQVTSDAVDTALQADLNAASVQIKLYLAQNGNYPSANDCNKIPADNTICLKVSNLNEYNYNANNSTIPPTFSLIAKNANGSSYEITDSTSPVKLTNSN